MLTYFTLSDFLVAQQSHELVIINDNQTFNLHTVSGLDIITKFTMLGKLYLGHIPK